MYKCGAGMTRARLTVYSSYPSCCVTDSGNPSECEDYSGCEYRGDFANGEVNVAETEVKCRSIAAFFDAANPSAAYWTANYANKKLRLKACTSTGAVEFEATIVDTCGDSDCNGCCTANAGSYGKLVDLEINTMYRNFGLRSPKGFPDTVYYEVV